jgi:hypothetical protein
VKRQARPVFDIQTRANTHLIKESAVVDIATELRKLVLQYLLKLKTTGLQ